MQTDLMQKYPNANLAVYAVWYNMMDGDSRSRWPATLLTDPRVLHRWDENKVIGRWYGQTRRPIEKLISQDSSDFGPEIQWDAYYIYAANARWTATPAPLIRWGRTILASHTSLVQEVDALFGTRAGQGRR